MDKDVNDGVSYLMALKQVNPSPSGAANSPAPALQQEQPSGAADLTGSKFHGSDKRRAPRYKCEGSAQIREDGRDVHTWATFTDISLHGCYVEAQATYPAGTLLHLQLDANDIRLEVKGNVRVNYPYLGMGIGFVDLSPENDTLLRQMLATISHPCMIVGPGIASSLPSSSPFRALPSITNPEAAVQELIDFFETRQMLMRDDFLRILRKSQSPEIR